MGGPRIGKPSPPVDVTMAARTRRAPSVSLGMGGGRGTGAVPGATSPAAQTTPTSNKIQKKGKEIELLRWEFE